MHYAWQEAWGIVKASHPLVSAVELHDVPSAVSSDFDDEDRFFTAMMLMSQRLNLSHMVVMNALQENAIPAAWVDAMVAALQDKDMLEAIRELF